MNPSASLPHLVTALPLTDEIVATRPEPKEGQWVTGAPADSIDFQILSHEGKPKARRWDRELCFLWITFTTI